MKLRIGRLLAIAAFVCCGLAGARTLAQNAYITNFLSNNVSVIPTTNAVTATITVGGEPEGVAVSPDGSKVYVANPASNTVSVIDTAANTVTDTITGFSAPIAFGLFIQPEIEIPFSSLSATLVINGQQAAFTLHAFFGLGAGSSGINPPAQAVTLQVGPYTATIPAGSFRQLAYASTPVWAFKGTINDVSLLVEILALGDNSYQFFAAANPVNLTGVTNPVPVSFSIGNNAGSTSVIPFLTG